MQNAADPALVRLRLTPHDEVKIPQANICGNTHLAHHASCFPRISSWNAWRSISTQVKHQPRILGGHCQLVLKNPAARRGILLPCHREEGHVAACCSRAETRRIQIVGPIKTAREGALWTERSILNFCSSGLRECRPAMVHQRLVHAARAEARECRFPVGWSSELHGPGGERLAEARLHIKVAILEHDHPEMPRLGCGVLFAQRG